MTLAETEAEVERIASAAHHSRDDDREKLCAIIETVQALLQASSNTIRPLHHDARRRAQAVLTKAAAELIRLNPPAP